MRKKDPAFDRLRETGPISCEEARQILSRFNASHFRLPDKEHARYSIPANPRYDDDIRLAAFIDQVEHELAAAFGLSSPPPALPVTVEVLDEPPTPPPGAKGAL